MSTGTLENEYATDLMKYSRIAIERILQYSFEKAEKNNKKITIVDKANVLRCSRLWRTIGKEFEKKYPTVSVNYEYVDAMAYKLI